MVHVTKHRKIFYWISGILVGLSAFAFFSFGLNLGIDFTGGSLLYGEFSKKPLDREAIIDVLSGYGLSDVVVQTSPDGSVIIKMKEIDEKTHQDILKSLNEKSAELEEGNEFIQKSYESIGPSISSELSSKAKNAILFVLVAIVLFVAFAFRKVSYPLSSFKYGIATLAALFHDVAIPVGVFAFLGQYYGVEVTSAFIAAVLTVLGYSVNDTIVVFDRVRENLTRHIGKDFEDTVNISVNQTFVRSLNTSLTVVLVLLAIYFFGGESIKYFALALMIGVISGTYSSIFIGSNLLVTLEKMQNKNKS